MSARGSTTLIVTRCLAFLLLALCIAGCSPTAEPQGIWGKLWGLEVGPDYKRPQVRPVEQYRSQVGPSEANSLADLPWWQVFNDRALQNLIVTALEHNYDLQLAANRVEQARALVGVAASQLYPQIGYQAFAGREKTFIPLEQAGGNLTYNAFGGLLNLAWELDVWGPDSPIHRGRPRESVRPGVCAPRRDADAGERRCIWLLQPARA
ncbi:MAG TPA: TolC family protein [Candidatus Binataceae bacterium]|nr:TolC family protein [Candidatus Binataceae bacterium]